MKKKYVESSLMNDIIKRNMSGRKISVLFILTNILYVIMLTITIPKVMSYAGGMNLPDMMPAGYSAGYVNSLLNNLGEKGRDVYLYNQIPLDMIYPFLFGTTYCLLLAFIIKKLGKKESNLFYLCYIPLFAGLFDYFENIGIIMLLVSYPDNAIILSQTTNIFSVLKSTFTTISFIILIICLIALVLKLIGSKNKIKIN